MTISRPVLKYYGGKFKLAPWIISHFPAHNRYVESFGGAASVLMLKEPSRYEVYNEKNKEITNFFKVLRDPASAGKLRHLLRLTPYSRAEWMDCFEPSSDIIEQARRTIVKSLMCRGSFQGTSRTGFRNYTKNYHYLPQQFKEYSDHLKAFSKRLTGVIIEEMDALKIMDHYDEEDTLQYADPPYLVRRRMDHGYDEEMITEAQHEKFLKGCLLLKSKVIISHYQCDMYNDILRGWKRVSKKSNTDSGRKGQSTANEVLYLNPQCFNSQLTIF